MLDFDWFERIFFGFLGVVILALVTIIIVVIFDPSVDEKVAKITEPRYIAHCNNFVIDDEISGTKIKYWKQYTDSIVIYNMDGTKTWITDPGVCTFQEIKRSSNTIVLGE